MAHAKPEKDVDEDGLLVQRYDSTILVVLPPRGFGEQILRYARSSLYNVHVGTWSVSSEADDMIHGRLQDFFMVDGPLDDADMERFSGLLIAGSEGRSPLADDERVLALVRAADASKKPIGGWGNALEVLARAGVLKGRRVTGDPALADVVSRARGRYTGRQVEVSAHLVTARDEGAGMRFGQCMAEMVRA